MWIVKNAQSKNENKFNIFSPIYKNIILREKFINFIYLLNWYNIEHSTYNTPR